MSGWSDVTLGDVLELKRGYDLPTPKREAGRVPIISSSGPSDFHSEAKVQGPGVITGRYGTIGQVFFTRDAFWPLNTALYVRDFKGNDPRFCYYFLKTFDWNKFNDKSGVPGVNRNDAHQEPVLLPPLHEQRAIASILGALDDKIELNRRMSTTLEDMARSMYRSWFVDFDPVHAKMEGRQPAFMDEATAALFPDRFGEDGLPEGWTKAKLASIFKSRTERDDGRNIKEFSSSNGGIFPRDQKYNKKLSASGNKNKVAYRGDFVFGLSRKVLNFGLLDQEIGAFSSAYRIYSVDAGYDFSLYVYEYMKLFPDYYYQAVSASSREGQSISEKNLFDLFVPVPIDSIQKAFFEETSAFKKRVVSLVSETNNLVELRDSLLPKLMSGELRVGEAREQVEEVA